jgi:ubiquinone/menaquinone biosynthesis C-methylase UbiE
MPVWSIIIVLVLVLLAIAGFSRITIPRDPDKEGPEDAEFALAYDKTNHWLIFSILRYLVVHQLERHRPQGIMIDAGCGPGHLDFAIAAKFDSVSITGVDISTDMIAAARKNGSQRRTAAPVNFVVASVEELPYKDDYCDFIVSSLSLHHWKDPEKALTEFHRVLKTGGRCLIFDLRRDSPGLLYGVGTVAQRLFAPGPIKRTNGAIGSIWSAYTLPEMRSMTAKTSFRKTDIRPGWGWMFIWLEK